MNAQQLAFKTLLTLNRFLDVLIQSIKVDLRDFCVCCPNSCRLTCLRLPSIGQEKLQCCHNAAVSFFPRVFHDIDAELYDITAAYFEGLRGLTGLTETLVIDECSVAASRVLETKTIFNFSNIFTTFPTHLQVELSFLIPELCMITRQHFTVKNGIVVADFCACYCPSDLHRFVGLE